MVHPVPTKAEMVNSACTSAEIAERVLQATVVDALHKVVMHTLSANWAVDEDVSLFASYGFGFRSGGFNSSGSEATINQNFGGLFYAPGVPNISDVKDDYKSETSEAAEIGMKSVLLDRHLQVNLAAFYTTVEDLQYFNFFVGQFGLLRVVTNIDEVTIQGVEADFHWNVTDSVSLYGGYSYIDSNIDQYNGRPYTKGNKVPYAPEYTGNLGVEWLYPMTASLQLLARLDATFVGETWFSPVQDETLPNLALPSLLLSPACCSLQAPRSLLRYVIKFSNNSGCRICIHCFYGKHS
jgi:iron complex outermembrane receptor protein